MKVKRVVRAIGSGACHTVDLDDANLMEIEVLTGSSAKFLTVPKVVVDCGVTLIGKQVVVMQSAKGVCRACRHITGVTGVEDGELVHG